MTRPSSNSLSTEPLSPDGRETCYQCFRPTALCLCDEIIKVQNGTRVVIVQHARESFHPLNTARLTELVLENCEVLRGSPAALSPALRSLSWGERPALLYPSEDALDLDELSEEEYPTDVLVIDGTWHHAKTLMRDLPELASLRRVRFTPKRASEYQIRREPQEDYLSTIEAVSFVLEKLEPALNNLSELRRIFLRMIEKNIHARQRAEPSHIRNKERRNFHKFHPLFFASSTSCIYAEGAGQSERGPVALYLQHSGGVLRWLIQRSEPVHEKILERLALTEQQYLEQAQSSETVLGELRQHLRRTGTHLVAYHPSTAQLLNELGLKPGSLLCLKGAYCDWLRFLAQRGERELPERWGSLLAAVEREELEETVALWLSEHKLSWEQRAEARLAQTIALFAWMKAEVAKNPIPEDFRSFQTSQISENY